MKIVKLMPTYVILQLMLIAGYSQIIPDKTGKIIVLGVAKDTLQNLTLAPLKAYDQTLKDNYRKQLLKSVNATIKNLNNARNNLRNFYTWLWDTITVRNIDGDLTKLKNLLQTGTAPASSFAYLEKITYPVRNNLFSSDPAFFSLRKDPYNKQLWLKNVYNQFLIDYYTDCFETAGDDIKEFTLEKWIAYSSFLTKKSDEVTGLLKLFYKDPDNASIELLHKLKNFNYALNNHSVELSGIKTLLQDNWFRQWIWFRGGALRLNPLDFTTDAFLKKFPSTDTKKALIYEEYLDSLKSRYIRYDSTERIAAFQKILTEMGNGTDRFSLKAWQNAEKENDLQMKKLLRVNKLINNIKIPETDEDAYAVSKRRKFLKKKRLFTFYNYSFDKKDVFSSGGNIEKYPTSPVHTGQEKIIAVHNIPEGYAIDIKTNSTTIIDRSQVQIGLDSIINFATQVSGLVLNFSAFSALGIPAQRISNRVIPQTEFDANHQKQSLAANPHARPAPGTVLEFIKYKIKDKENKYDSAIFIIVHSRNMNDILDDPYIETNNAQKEFINKFVADYLTELKNQIETAIAVVRADSLHLSHLNAVFSNSTLPPQELEPQDDEAPVFYTSIHHTDPSDAPVKSEVTVIGVKDKDTAKIAKFSYKVGKNYRFQLSAGIAYTFSNVRQTVAKEESGQIAISNHAQQYRLAVGVHIHWGKGLFLQDNRFAGNFLERSAVYIGVGVPTPLENVYLGYSYDFFPGIKTTVGAHLARNNKYTIQNNAIIEERLRYQWNLPFVAVQIDPTGFLNALNVLFKN